MTPRIKTVFSFLLHVSTLLALVASGRAQPSQGPHGPVRQTYTAPAGVRVLHVAPNGADKAEGSEAAPLSLAQALAVARTGDVVVLQGGEYRCGDFTLNQGVTLQPRGDDQPVIKGTEVATTWEKLPSGLWRTKWTKLFPGKPQSWWWRENENTRTPLHLFNNDLVFIDGHRLKTAGWPGEVKADSFCVDYEHGEVYIGTDPTGRVVEITAHEQFLKQVSEPVNGLKSDGRGVVVRGLSFTGYARCAIDVLAKEAEGKMDESQYGKDITGVTLEHVSITHCGVAGAYLRGDRVRVTNCLFTDVDSENLYVISTSDSIVERSVFKRANVENMTGHFPAALKVFNQTHRFICRDNVIVDQPNAHGIWYDVGHHDGLVINNYFENVQYAFFLEISNSGVCAGNVFVNCDAGVMLMNSRNAEIYHNTFVNSPLATYRYGRVVEGDVFGWHSGSGPGLLERKDHTIVGNLFVSDENFRKPFVRFDQPDDLSDKLTTLHVKRFDHNTYVRVGGGAKTSLINWTPVAPPAKNTTFATLEELRALAGQFEQGSRFFDGVPWSPFASWETRNFALKSPLPAIPGEESLPAKVREALGWSVEDAATPGAYPWRR
ncbi:right-handed parallel beta-helix repeat-containing protein [Nibricoccus sp. IMCC34717]|uniref:right-handed parallel beta-helix repeat-containing protein n=1 Tax=Nibricoccus sp. IMCC34717 TaxID=3034021 RepID=UPI00384FF5EC